MNGDSRLNVFVETQIRESEDVKNPTIVPGKDSAENVKRNLRL